MVQETTAAFLTAALASGKQVPSGAPETASLDQETPGTNVAMPLTYGHVLSPDAGQSSHCQTTKEEKNHEDSSKVTFG